MVMFIVQIEVSKLSFVENWINLVLLKVNINEFA